jgi:pimeloyl-ACP methyl ester carboxylesterase
LTDAEAPRPQRGCAASLGLVLLAPAIALGLGWLSYALSWWSAALALGLALSALGLLLLSTSRSFALRALSAGALLVLGPWLARVVLVRGSEQIRLTTLPGDGGPRLVNRLYPETDGTVGMGSLITSLGRLHDPEAARFSDILRAAYARIEPDPALLPTPAIASYLGQQSPSAFDTIVIRPPEQRVAPDGALVFLHGYAGSFYVYCWEAAQAAATANLLTLCPATGPQGTWWDDDGDATLKATLDYAHEIGMNRVYLAGLSNGGAGASVLALKYTARLSGLILISGMRAPAPPPLPVLVVQGAADQMMTAPYARAYAANRPNVTYREIAGGHLVFLSETEKVRPLLAQFLSDLERRATALPGRK